MKAQARAPMTPIVKLVFGIDYDKARLTEFAAALSYAQRQDVALGGFQDFIEKQPGGLKALVAAERQARRPEPKPDTQGRGARARLRAAPPISLADVPADEEFAVVVTRRGADGTSRAGRRSSRTRRWSNARSAAPPEASSPFAAGLSAREARVYRPARTSQPPEHNLFMTAHTRLDPPLVESIRKALTGNALPGETQGLSREAEREAAEFLAEVAAQPQAAASSRWRSNRPAARPATAGCASASSTTTCRSWSIRSPTPIAARQLTIHRLLHPVVCVDRDDKGELQRSSRCAATRTAANR